MNQPVLLKKVRVCPEPGLYRIEVFHDDECRVSQGGVCSCKPLIHAYREERERG